ncbi:ABC1 kinase family protein [Saliterribacillus persicus]|uniref:2-octaprenylphenol hydroxylase n=1 Tax=Saliterribacillus persicus TaxID=930114 RepID=A0A368Y9I3_9BACI|nr:AarF/ABC1/UbiB kinase family protein [Saliterribacillus persicus]RCW76931.1 2-octaprenylphenol hydroxylase [Saliterribacillus persicus]
MQRYREIAVAFSRNGFGYVVKELGLDQLFPLPKRALINKEQQKHRKTVGERIRLILEELGPTFIKMGQMASMRPDIIPKDVIKELELLQDQLSPFSYPDVEAMIEQELGAPVHELFQSFDKEPLGVASIGQVHKAVLHSGEEVAVKVQRPNVDKQIRTDLEILHELAERAEHRLYRLRKYQLKNIVEEFSKAILDELDFVTEGRNADIMSKQFRENKHIAIPKIFWDYSSKKVLTMEHIEGVKLNALEELDERGYDRELIAERFSDAILFQIFKDGFFHADPHMGNMLALPGEKIALLDFGMVGRLSPEMQTHFASLIIAMVRQKPDAIIKAISKMGVVPEEVNQHELRGDIEQFMIKYYDVSLSEVSLGESVTDLFSIAHEHKISIPTDLTLVGKALITMESVIEPLHPDLSVMEVAEPFGRALIKERYNPKNIAENIYDQLDDYGDVLHDMPKIVQELSAIVKKRKVPVEISIPAADSFFAKLDRVSNRLSFSIVLLAFSLIMVGLIIGSALGRQTSMLWNIPAIEIGFVIAILMFAWMMFSIFRSGRF